MNSELAAQLNPKEKSDAERQRVLEGLVFNPNKPDPEIWRTIIPILEHEPIIWIQHLEARLLKRLPFHVDFITAAMSLLNSTQGTVRFEGARLIHQVVDRLVFEKSKEALLTFEENLLKPLLSQLNNETIVTQQKAWIELYQTLGCLSVAPAVSEAMIDLLPKGGDAALLVLSQYAQKGHPANCLEAVLSGFETTKSDDAAIHLLRALKMTLPKTGDPSGYASTESVIQTLLSGVISKSENVRREACAVLASRAKAAKKEKTNIPLEDEAWNALFKLYDAHLSMPETRDKDEANMAIAALPINSERLERLFEIMHRVEDEMEKQSIVGLIGSFKASESRGELIKLLRENFAGLRLEAQRIALESISKYLPDEEVEVEMDKLLSGRGLHSDIMSKLGDKLFAPLPSLKVRLMHWLDLHPKTGRPLLEQFPLPMMHIKVIIAARKLAGDAEIGAQLRVIEPLLMMNDAIVRLHETLQLFPENAK